MPEILKPAPDVSAAAVTTNGPTSIHQAFCSLSHDAIDPESEFSMNVGDVESPLAQDPPPINPVVLRKRLDEIPPSTPQSLAAAADIEILAEDANNIQGDKNEPNDDSKSDDPLENVFNDIVEPAADVSAPKERRIYSRKMPKKPSREKQIGKRHKTHQHK